MHCNQQVVLGDSCELLTGQITTQLVKVAHCYVATIEGTTQLPLGDRKLAHAQLVTHVEVSFTWGGGQLVLSWKFMTQTFYKSIGNHRTAVRSVDDVSTGIVAENGLIAK